MPASKNGSAPAVDSAYSEAIQLEALRQSFVQQMKVARSGDTFVVDVAYTSPNPVFAATAVNVLMEEYLRLSSKQRTSNIERNKEWLSVRIEELGREVEEAENAVANYRQDFDLLTPEGQQLPTEVAIGAAIQSMVSLRSQALSLDIEISQLRENIARRDIASVQLDQADRTQALIGFQARYADLQNEEQNLLRNWSEDSPVVQDVRVQLASTGDLILGELNKVAAQLEGRYEALNRRLTATESVIDELRSEYGEDVRKAVDLRRLEREMEAKRTIHQELLEDYNNASQLLTFDTTSAREIAWAVPPERKSAPKSVRIVLLAAMGSFILGVSAILLIEALDTSFRRKEDVTEFLKLKVLGAVPHFDSEMRRWGFRRSRQVTKMEPSDIYGDNLSKVAGRFDFAARNPFSFAADALRNLHTELRFHADGGGQRYEGGVLGFTSTERGEGKTTTAANFAALMSSRGEATALVDLDLITQQLNRQVGSVALEDVQAMRRAGADWADHDVLSGPQDTDGRPVVITPPQGLTGHQIGPSDVEKLKSFFRELRQSFDYVVVDLPPLQGTADTQLLAMACDDIVFLVKWGATPREKALNALQRLNSYQSQVVGVLLTQAPMRAYRSYNKHEGVEYYA